MLQDKVIIVTGGASGMGRATALEAAQAGARIVVADRDVEAGRETADALLAQGMEASFAEVDIASEASVSRMVEQALSRYGRLDGAFNNAGVEMSFKRLHETSLTEWRRVIDINLTGTFLCLKYEIEALFGSGGGAIVNTASVLGQVSAPGTSDYTAAKHGVIGLTRAAAADYGTSGIRVNAVLPGTIETPMITQRAMQVPAFADSLNANIGHHLVKRMGTPSEVARAVVWLLSDNASFVTGAAVPVDGGYLAN